MTQLEAAKKGLVTPEMRRVAASEGVKAEWVRSQVAKGRLVIPKNRFRKIKRLSGIGSGLKTKVNANIGTSKDSSGSALEIPA